MKTPNFFSEVFWRFVSADPVGEPVLHWADFPEPPTYP
jgi:hypothetical protein